jgi:MraZ protein
MAGFLGKYEHQMDAKGRVSLPSAFRREEDGGQYVLLQYEKPYLCLFPRAVFLDVQARLVELRKRDASAWHPVREIVSNAVEVEPDKQGRILVPAWLKDAAQLDGKKVLLSGNIDRVELWNPELYEKIVRASSPQAVSSFAHQVFG